MPAELTARARRDPALPALTEALDERLMREALAHAAGLDAHAPLSCTAEVLTIEKHEVKDDSGAAPTTGNSNALGCLTFPARASVWNSPARFPSARLSSSSLRAQTVPRPTSCLLTSSTRRRSQRGYPFGTESTSTCGLRSEEPITLLLCQYRERGSWETLPYNKGLSELNTWSGESLQHRGSVKPTKPATLEMNSQDWSQV